MILPTVNLTIPVRITRARITQARMPARRLHLEACMPPDRIMVAATAVMVMAISMGIRSIEAAVVEVAAPATLVIQIRILVLG